MKRKSPEHCREVHCRTRLDRHEALYNGGYCDKCIEENIEKGRAEKLERKTNRQKSQRRSVGYDPQKDQAIRK